MDQAFDLEYLKDYNNQDWEELWGKIDEKEPQEQLHICMMLEQCRKWYIRYNHGDVTFLPSGEMKNYHVWERYVSGKISWYKIFQAAIPSLTQAQVLLLAKWAKGHSCYCCQIYHDIKNSRIINYVITVDGQLKYRNVIKNSEPFVHPITLDPAQILYDDMCGGCDYSRTLDDLIEDTIKGKILLGKQIQMLKERLRDAGSTLEYYMKRDHMDIITRQALQYYLKQHSQ